MSGKITETDKDVLKRIMSEPTFEAVRQAAIRENAKRKQAISDVLRNATPGNEVPSRSSEPVKPDVK